MVSTDTDMTTDKDTTVQTPVDKTASPLVRIRQAYIQSLNLATDDATIGEVLTCGYLSNIVSFTKEPVWLQIVGPPASHKTESLRPLIDYPDTIAVSSLTMNSLISGHRDADGNDPSLILKLNNKNLIIKDMTTVHTMDRVSRDKIFGDFRDAFDGFCSKASGMSGLTTYKARFGVLFAITEVIDAYSNQLQQLGERFLAYRTFRYQPSHQQACEYLKHVLRVAPFKHEWQGSLRSAVAEGFDEIKQLAIHHGQPQIPEPILDKLIAIAHMLTYFRTSPVNGTPVSGEMASRAVQQLMNIGSIRCVADRRDTWNEEDLSLCRRLVLDTLPATRRRLIQILYRSKGRPPIPLSVESIAEACRCPIADLEALFLQYINTNLLEAHLYNRTLIRYTLHPEIRRLLEYTGLFDPGPHLPGMWIKDKFRALHKETPS
jgi:hypothetical protein